MNHLVQAVRSAIATQNWYAALTLSLTLPDICGRIDDPSEASSQRRYVRWYRTHLLPSYEHDRFIHPTTEERQRMIAERLAGIVRPPPPAKYERVTFLSGDDCYALRCAFLHQGEFGIEDQRAQDVLRRFHFTAQLNGPGPHCNLVGDVLQLDTSRFCDDVCAAVTAWLAKALATPQLKERLDALGTIHVGTSVIA